jgi:hypothetical protein
MIRNIVDNMVNPYIASTAPPQGADRVNSMITILRTLLYVFPLFPVLVIYMAWALSWFALGRVPVEYRDYPENFGIIFFLHGLARWPSFLRHSLCHVDF